MDKMMQFMLCVLLILFGLFSLETAETDFKEPLNRALYPSGFYDVDGATFYVSDPLSYMTWFESEGFCNGLNMTLVTLDTEEKNAAVKNLIFENTEGTYIFSYWSSGRKEGDDWTWNASGAPFTFTDWRAGQPMLTGPNQACVVFHGGSGWDDYTCLHSVCNFVCEY